MGWGATKQHAKDLEGLFHPELVERDVFDKLVTYRTQDMNSISPDLYGKFDFVWTTCSLASLARASALP